jgi:hypothetical protein
MHAVGYDYTQSPAKPVTLSVMPDGRMKPVHSDSSVSFLENRQFRIFHEFNIIAGAELWLRFISVRDQVLLNRTLTVAQGNLRFATGPATGSGTWTSKPVFRMNGMASAPAFVGSTVGAYGGTATAQTETEVILLETGNNQAVSVASSFSAIGIPPGTSFVRLQNTGSGALRGVYSVTWAEEA